MSSEQRKLTYTVVCLILLSMNFLVSNCCKMPGLRQTNLDYRNMKSFGNAMLSPLSIIYYKGSGALWYNQKMLVHPRFEIKLHVMINSNACNEEGTEAFLDGFTIILSKTPNYLNGDGGTIGYDNLFDAIVTEIDNYQNPGDSAMNTVSIHKCFKSGCTYQEGPTTIQRNNVINNEKCSRFVYDVNIQYDNGNYKVFVGDILVVETSASLESMFDSNAYLGFTATQQSRRRDIQIHGSYICEDDFVYNFFYATLLNGSQWVLNQPFSVQAGNSFGLYLKMIDSAGQIVPHTWGLNMWTWNLRLDHDCKFPTTPEKNGALTAIAYYDPKSLTTTLSGCNIAGTYTISINAKKPTDLNYVLTNQVKFTVTAQSFEKLTFLGYDEKEVAEKDAIKSTDGEFFFNWGLAGGNFTINQLASRNYMLSVYFFSSDIYGNLVSLGEDFSQVVDSFGINVTDPLGNPVKITGKANFNGKYTINIPVSSAGVYIVTSPKFTNIKNRYKFLVHPGLPSPTLSQCSIVNQKFTPTYDAGIVVSYLCTFYDEKNNLINPTLSQGITEGVYGIKLERISPASEIIEDTTNFFITNDNVKRTYTTSKNGVYVMKPHFIQKDKNVITINGQLNSFTVIPTPNSIKRSAYFDYNLNKFVTYSNVNIINYKSSYGTLLAIISLLDIDNTPFAQIGYSDSFQLFTGTIYNEHDPTFNPVKLSIEFTKFKDNLNYIGVILPDADKYLKKSSHFYILELRYLTETIKISLNVPLGNTNGRAVCIHPMEPANTLWVPSANINNSLSVNSDVLLGQLILQTTDNFFFNNKIDVTRFKITSTPENDDTKFYIAENVNVDGYYNLRVFSNKANSYTVKVAIDNDIVIIKSLAVKVEASRYMVTVKNNSLNKFLNVDSPTDANGNYVLKSTNNDEIPTIYFDAYDEFENLLAYLPEESNNYLSIKVKVTVKTEFSSNSIDINLAETTQFAFSYNSSTNTYQLVDNYAKVGQFTVTITTAFNNNNNQISFTYYNTAGAPSIDTSYATLVTGDLRISETAVLAVYLNDQYSASIAQDKTIEAYSDKISVNGFLPDSSTVPFTLVSKAPVMFALQFKTEKLQKQSSYTVSVILNGKMIIPCKNCNFNVNYEKYLLKNCKLSAILAKTLEMSYDSRLKIDNDNTSPLFSMLFYDQSGKQLQYVNPSQEPVAKIKGNGIGTNNEATLVNMWQGTNRMIFKIRPEDGVTGISVKGLDYVLEITNGTDKVNYPLEFNGGGQDWDETADPDFTRTFFSNNSLQGIAGADLTFNIELRTSKNYRVANDVFQDPKLFKLATDKADVGFSYNVQPSPKKGNFIVSVKYQKVSIQTAPHIITVSYTNPKDKSNNILKPVVNIIIGNSDLAKFVIETSNFLPNGTDLKTAVTIKEYVIQMKAYDAYNNLFVDIFNSSVYSMDRIQRLFNLLHYDGFQITSIASTDISKSLVILTLTSRYTGTVALSSTFLKDDYSFEVLPGPISEKYSFGAIATVEKTIQAGNDSKFKVFPRDAYNNIIKDTELTDEDFKKIKVNLITASSASRAPAQKIKNPTDYSVLFTDTLTEADVTKFSASINDVVIKCNNCQVNVALAEILFTNSALSLDGKLVSTTIETTLTIANFPNFTFKLKDKFNNVYDIAPIPFQTSFYANFINSEVNLKLCNDFEENTINIYVCKDDESRNKWKFLITNKINFVNLFYTPLNGQEQKLAYPINLEGGDSDSDASNLPWEITKTFLSKTSISTIAGQWSSFMLELRTLEGKRHSAWFATNDKIQIKFELDNGDKNIYNFSINTGDKFGQYIIKYVINKSYKANSMIITIDNKLYPNNIALVVNPGKPDPTKTVLSAKDGSDTDTPYDIKVNLYDSLNNIADILASDIPFNVVSPKQGYSIVSSITKNVDLSFNLRVLPIFTGFYTISSPMFASDFKFNTNPGVPSVTNSLANVETTLVAGSPATLSIIPYDANNNYISPSTFLKSNPFNVAYKFKSQATGDFVPYLSIPFDKDNGIKNVTISDGTTRVAYVYTTTLKIKGLNFFRVTLDSDKEIKCTNCATNVTPAAIDFNSFLITRFDPENNKYINFIDNANEDNFRVDLVYRLIPRDVFLNVIDSIDNRMNYNSKLIDFEKQEYLLLNKGDGAGAYLEFTKDDSDKNKFKYQSLPSGTYSIVFADNNTNSMTKNIILLGDPSAEGTSLKEIDVQNTVVNEKQLSFVAGQVGYLLIEIRSTSNKRRNSWDDVIDIRPNIQDELVKEDTNFKVNPVVPAGVKGVYFAKIESTMATNFPRVINYTLDIYVKDKTGEFVKVNKVNPPLVLDISPAPMKYSLISEEFIQNDEIVNKQNKENNNADQDLEFNVVSYDDNNNLSRCDSNEVKLQVLDPNRLLVPVTASREVLTGLCKYKVSTTIAGQYTISGNLKISYKYNNKYGFRNELTSIAVLNSKSITAGEEASITIQPRDKNSNIIDANSVKGIFIATVTSPSGKQLSSEVVIKNNELQMSVKLTEKGAHSWKASINGTPVIDIVCDKCVTTVNPNIAELNNSIISIENSTGVFTALKKDDIIIRNNNNPLSFYITLVDTFNNPLDTINEKEYSITDIILNAKDTTPLDSFNVKLNEKGDKFAVGLNSNLNRLFSKLVSGEGYELRFNINIKSSAATLAFGYKVKIASDMDDSKYGNGLYSVEKSQIVGDKTDMVFPVNTPQRIVIVLKTAQDLIYNDYIPIEFINFEVSPEDSKFSFKAYQNTEAIGYYNIDISTKSSKPDSQLKFSILLKDPITNAFKPMNKQITLTIVPGIPPNFSQTKIISEPSETELAGKELTIKFTLSDEFGNMYTNNKDIINNFVFTANKIPVTKEKMRVNLSPTDRVTYEISYTPDYPPKNCELFLSYKDDIQQVALFSDSIFVKIVSAVEWSNTVISSTNISQMKAGNKLDATVTIYDRNNICIDLDVDPLITAKVLGPIEGTDESSKTTREFTFIKIDKPLAECKKAYSIYIEDGNNWDKIGTYKITINVNNQYTKSYTQNIVPDDLDKTKFLSKYTMSGNFTPGRVVTGTQITFSITGRDRFYNNVTTSIKKLMLKLTAIDGTVLKEADEKWGTFDNLTPNDVPDYKVTVLENTRGTLTGSLIIYKKRAYIIQYYWDNQAINVDNSKGPNQITVIQGVCAATRPIIDIDDSLKTYILGETASFNVKCQDLFLNKIENGGEVFNTYINVMKANSGTGVEVKTKITDNSNGSYKFEFIPVFAGSYTVRVDLRGQVYGGAVKTFVMKDIECPLTQRKCPNNNTCKEKMFDCLDSKEGNCTEALPFYCSKDSKMQCVKSKIECDCPTGYVKCDYPHGVCVPKDQLDIACAFSLNINCPVLYPLSPSLNEDGICRVSINESPSPRVCPIGGVLCPDLSCRDSIDKCIQYDECPNIDDLRCPDQSCVKDQVLCPTLVTCPNLNMYVCPGGQCVPSELECKSLTKCYDPNFILCSDNTCVDNVKNCPKSVSCGHGLSLCQDNICRKTCSLATK